MFFLCGFFLKLFFKLFFIVAAFLGVKLDARYYITTYAQTNAKVTTHV